MKKIILLFTLLISLNSFSTQEESTNTGPFIFQSTPIIKIDEISEKNPAPKCKIYVVYKDKKVFVSEATDEKVNNAWTKPNKKKNQLATTMVYYGGSGAEYMLTYSNNSIKVYRKYIEESDEKFKFELLKTIPLTKFTKDTAKAIELINKYLKNE